MIREALQYVVGLSKPILTEVDGRQYSTDKLREVLEPVPTALEVATLSGLVDYTRSIYNSIDNRTEKIFIHVERHDAVSIRSGIGGPFEQRKCFMRASWGEKSFGFGSFMDHESFMIGLQSSFAETDDRKSLLAVLSRVTGVLETSGGDDGTSQSVEIRKGIHLCSDATIRNPVILAPRRTFDEIEQPESLFVFRIKEEGKGIRCALFEADNGAWKSDAMRRIKDYLGEQLPGLEIIA